MAAIRGDRGRGRDVQVGIFVEVDSLEGKLAETFAAVLVGRGVRGYASAAHFAADTPFVGHNGR